MNGGIFPAGMYRKVTIEQDSSSLHGESRGNSMNYFYHKKPFIVCELDSDIFEWIFPRLFADMIAVEWLVPVVM